MDMVKFFLGIAIVAFASFCGQLLAKKYRQREQFFKQLRAFNERFLSEITYYRRPLKSFISSYHYQGEFAQALQDFFDFLNENPSTPFFVIEGENYYFLKEDERKWVGDYFLMLGKGDSSSQKGYFSSVKDALAKLQSDAETERKRYGDLYVKIGFLCGLLLLILII